MLTQDPIGLAGGVNLYAYAGNNPSSFSDPWGLKESECCFEDVLLSPVIKTFGSREALDPLNEQRIRTLAEAIQDRARTVANVADLVGEPMRIPRGDAYRSDAEQDAIDPANTSATAGLSYHNYGLAFDMYPVVNGRVNVNGSMPSQVVGIAKSQGFSWGGDWQKPDGPHFQAAILPIRQLYNMRNLVRRFDSFANTIGAIP